MKTTKYIISTVLLLILCGTAFAQKITVSGTVTDENGAAMPGVTVVDKQNSGKGTLTDLQG